MTIDLSSFKEGQEVVLEHKLQPLTIRGKIHMEFDKDLGRLEVIEGGDTFIVTENDMFWTISRVQ